MSRLKKYITEKIDHDKINWDEEGYAKDIIKQIKKKCKPWIKESKGLPGYRASRQEQTKYWIKKSSVRKNRRPLTMKQEDHELIDDLFNRRYGWRARSNVLFTQGSAETHYFYGPLTYVVYPIGPIRYLWTPSFGDLTPVIETLRYELEHDFDIPQEKLKGKLIKGIQKLIKELYTDKGLYTALSKYPNHEIMVNCKNYYVIPAFVYEDHIEG
ncbi:unnamed protein product, partial [marine sediment metagenome]